MSARSKSNYYLGFSAFLLFFSRCGRRHLGWEVAAPRWWAVASGIAGGVDEAARQDRGAEIRDFLAAFGNGNLRALVFIACQLE